MRMHRTHSHTHTHTHNHPHNASSRPRSLPSTPLSATSVLRFCQFKVMLDSVRRAWGSRIGSGVDGTVANRSWQLATGNW